MANKYYMLSFDTDIGGRRFFFTGNKKGNHPNYAYGKACYTTMLGKAKLYKTEKNAKKAGRALCIALGFRKQILVHEWNPISFDSTKIVYIF